MIKLVLFLAILAIVVALVALLVWTLSPSPEKPKATKALPPRNPDAAWLYSQGLTREEIELAFEQAGRLK